MQQLVELIPLILFFTVFFNKGETIEIGSWTHELDGIYSATAVLMIATVIQVALTWLFTKRLEKRVLLLFAVVMVMGALTLILHNKLFIQWKPTIFNWAMALALIGSRFIGDGRNIPERTIGSQLTLPKHVWARLNRIWIIYFFVLGALNLYVAYGFSEETWVTYKLYSAIGFSLFLMVVTTLILAPHLKEQEKQDS